MAVSLSPLHGHTVKAQTYKHINTFAPNYSPSLSLTHRLSLSLFFLSLKFEIRVESKVSIFIKFSSEIYYFGGIGKPNRRSLAGEDTMGFFRSMKLANLKKENAPVYSTAACDICLYMEINSSLGSEIKTE